jgi:hypothetical protein
MAKLFVISFFLLMTVFPSWAHGNDQPSKAQWAVLVIDVQPCFVEGGSLAVADANAAYVRDVQWATRWFRYMGLKVLGSRDYHPSRSHLLLHQPSGNSAFDVIELPDGRMQVLWPPHCVQTPGTPVNSSITTCSTNWSRRVRIGTMTAIPPSGTTAGQTPNSTDPQGPGSDAPYCVRHSHGLLCQGHGDGRP